MIWNGLGGVIVEYEYLQGKKGFSTMRGLASNLFLRSIDGSSPGYYV
ncbi:unnamed protein product [Arabidopsis halleri]